MQDYLSNIQYNNDAENSVNVPFGRISEWYLANHPLLKDRRLKCLSRLYTSGLVKEGIINVQRVKGAVDFAEWTTRTNETKSTNRIDDVLTLTSKGNELLKQINLKKKDKLCWSWIMYCAGNGNTCQRACGGIGNCKKGFKSEVRITSLTKSHPLKITIQGNHVPQSMLLNSTPKVQRFNFLRNVRNKILISRRADYMSTKEIKAKLLVSINGADENTLFNALNSQKVICTNDKLKQLIAHDDKRFKDNAEDSPQRFYQLTLSDEFFKECTRLWITKNNAGFATPIAFGMSNKENNHTIRLAISSIKNNHVTEITPCSNINPWNPVAMIDKHRPTKLGVDGLLSGTILCWFHIMQSFGENLKNWNINQSLRYPIALGFKLIGRCRSKDDALFMTTLFNAFIDNLNMDNVKKEKIKNDDVKNCICEEWCIQFIDAGRLPINDEPLWTTNNYTERINRTIEATYSGKQTVLTFVERLYGVKLIHENITEENTGILIYEAGLVTAFNMQSVEQQDLFPKITQDMLRRLNCGRLYFLLGMVEKSDNSDFYYVKKSHNCDVISPYDHQPLNSESVIEKLGPLFKQLNKNYNIQERHDYYIANILTCECFNCFDFIWNGSFRNVCKHCHAARIFITSLQNHDNVIKDTKEKLVAYFKNKQRVLPPELKNYNIYQGDIEVAFQEIVKEYNEKGNMIFFTTIDQDCKVEIDPFRPNELSQRNLNPLTGAPPKPAANRRKPSRILRENNTVLNTPSIAKRKTDQIHKVKRGTL
ncbi:hypothetical protein RhiirC2_853023 [Rhizophagus irregularis]|uniref:SWIM-type domain-containing protein n=2 Tax=Rhizophagus irregularis TaxID=588596 RepID=A0A2N1MX72_9GLOM|nr:hypothetical protein RhiirC2_853023 [Rhizophagus irregularis]